MKRLWGIALLFTTASVALAASGDRSGLGTFSFPNSGAAEAQEAFLAGVGMLHSFEWEDAAEEFQKAQQIDPNFVMAYWGEALSHTGGHHYPPEQDLAQARAALRKLGETREARLAKAPTERERMWLEAVELLYSAGDAQQGANAYADAMRRLYEKYPDDHEAATFFALALMRTVRRGEDSIRQDMEAGAIAQKVLRENPDHPGAAHFVIHAFDDPIHAPIALYAAHKYAKIAPEAVHALHMPSHIFVQRGMWDYLAQSNEESYAASVARVKRKGLSPTKYSWHALYWLEYAYLQQGRYDKARKCLEEIRAVATRPETTPNVPRSLARMEALYTIETENWQVPDIGPLIKDIESKSTNVHRHTAGAVLLAAGLSAARTKDLSTLERALSGLAQLETASEVERERQPLAIARLELEALLALAKGDSDRAIELMKKATAIEESMVLPSGPPGESDTDVPPKPSHELFGEILLGLDRPQEAAAQFDVALLRMWNRPRSLLGAARASHRAGKEAEARRFYEALVNTPGGGADIPGLAEAKEYLKRASDNP
jgi:tetratricopeptide (TPR) repeat protein